GIGAPGAAVTADIDAAEAVVNLFGIPEQVEACAACGRIAVDPDIVRSGDAGMNIIAERVGIRSRNRAGGEVQIQAAAPDTCPLRNGQRIAAARGEDARDVPATDHLVERPVRDAEELALAEGQFIQVSRVELMCDVEKRRAIFGVEVEAIRR